MTVGRKGSSHRRHTVKAIADNRDTLRWPSHRVRGGVGVHAQQAERKLAERTSLPLTDRQHQVLEAIDGPTASKTIRAATGLSSSQLSSVLSSLSTRKLIVLRNGTVEKC